MTPKQKGRSMMMEDKGDMALPDGIIRRLTLLSLAAALSLSGCAEKADPERAETEARRGVLRMRLNQYCLAHLPAGPVQTKYNDWDEVVAECSQQAWYQSNQCSNPKLCLEALDAPHPNQDTPHE